MAVTAPEQKKKLAPFRFSTRQRVQPVAVVPITLGTRVTTEIPRVGFLAGIFLRVDATVTLSAAGALAVFSPWSIFRRVAVNLNIGSASVVDLSGMGLFAVNRDMITTGFDPTNPTLMNAPVALGANVWKLSLFVPVAANDLREFTMGLINLQAPEVRCTVDLSFANAGADIATNFTSITGNVTIHYMYYEVPNPSAVMYPPLMLHRLLEDRQTIVAVGDTTYVVPRQGTLLQLAHIVTLNSLVIPAYADALTTGVNQMRLRFNKTDEVYNILRGVYNLWSAIRSGTMQTNSGNLAFMWDFFDSGPERGQGDTRDTIDSESLSTLESIITVDGAATLGALACVDTVRRIVQVLQV